MAYEIPVQNVTLEASADLSSNQFYAIKVDSSGQAALAGDGENAVGILQNDPDAAGKAAEVMFLGVSKAALGGTVTAGDNLASDTNGAFVTATGGDAVIAIALEGGDSGEIITVSLVTRTSTGTNNTTYSTMTIPMNALNTYSDGDDIITEFTPAFNGYIEKVSFVTEVVTTDTDGDATITFEIDTTDVTGGVITLTDTGTAATSPDTVGKVIDGTAITDTNEFTDSQSISAYINITNAFDDGEGYLLVVLRAKN